MDDAMPPGESNSIDYPGADARGLFPKFAGLGCKNRPYRPGRCRYGLRATRDFHEFSVCVPLAECVLRGCWSSHWWSRSLSGRSPVFSPGRLGHRHGSA